jgi:putative ABC transport system permease protein
MWRNYIIVAFRNILKYKGYSIINMVGLAIGMASVLLIFLYILDETSFDRFHDNAKQIYRVGQRGQIGDTEFLGATTPAPLAEALMQEYEEVPYATRILEGINTVIWYKDKSFFETRYLYTDTNFFKVFTFPLVKGNPETALSRPFSMVITESTAVRYFGDEDPLGKVLHEADGSNYTITGVAKDPPHNAHFHFDFLASMNTYEWTTNNNWLQDRYFTYFILQKGVSSDLFEKKLHLLTEKYVGNQLQKNFGVSNYSETGDITFKFFLEPLVKIYLRSRSVPQMQPVSDIRSIYLFSIITIFIVVLAIINFSSLTTAKSATRAREMSMRKIMGSHRSQLIFQLLSESIVIGFIALAVALVLVELFLPTYNSIIGKSLSIDYFKKWFVIPVLISIPVVIGFLSGFYSSLSISSYNILTVLRGINGKSRNHQWYRSGLVVFQFSIAVVIMISTIVVYSQLQFMANRHLGFNDKNLLVIDRAYGLERGIYAFKKELIKHPGVESVTFTFDVPGIEEWRGGLLKRKDAPPENLVHFRMLAADQDFLETYQLEMVEGAFFSTPYQAAENSVVINESGAKSLGLDHPVGEILVPPGKGSYQEKWEIIGVVRDFHFKNMREEIENLLIFNPREFYISPVQFQAKYISVRMAENDISGTIDFIEERWKQFAINQPFRYYFMDDLMESLHKQDRITARVLTIFTVLSLFLASLGLLGLASFSAEYRTREIGIRKVMGSSAKEISILFMKEFGKWVALANILAWPAAYFLMQDWLENFSYRTAYPFWTFIAAGIGSLLIAMISVSYQTVDAALQNPADSIRHE